MSFEKSIDNYSVLYKFSTQPYIPSESWTTSKTFIPDTVLVEPSFELDEIFLSKKSEFIPDPIFGSTSWTRTSNT